MSKTETAPDRRARDVPETLRLRAIVPSLTVDDVRVSLEWYRDVVGFVVANEYESDGELRGVELVAGSTRLFISQDDGAKGWDRVKGEGLRLHLHTSQDVDEVAARIKERGGTLASEPKEMPWGGRAFDVVDPSGFRMTFSAAE